MRSRLRSATSPTSSFASPARTPRTHRSVSLAKARCRLRKIGRSYRAIGRRHGEDLYWFWIGTHEAYNRLLTRWQ